MDTDIRLTTVGNHWCKCQMIFGDQTIEIHGETRIEPRQYLIKVIDFLHNGGIRVHCIFNEPDLSYLLELHRQQSLINISIFQYETPFNNKIKDQGKKLSTHTADIKNFIAALNRATSGVIH